MSSVGLSEQERQVVFNAQRAMLEFRSAFRQALSCGTLTEVLVAERLDLELSLVSNEKGFDGKAINGDRYQIKYRAPKATSVDTRNFDFDYLVLAELDSDYQLSAMWRITADQARQIFVERPDFGKYQTTQHAIKRVAERLL